MTQHFEHSLLSQDIVLRQDSGASNFIETASGKHYPLIRIRNTVIEFANIVSVSLSAGSSSFLPRVSVVVEDFDYSIRQQDFAKEIDMLTIFIGNAQDNVYKAIKNDYLITEVSSSAGSAYVSFEAELYVPKLYESINSSWEDTSFNVLKEIAKECNLGFVSNVSNTNDKMVRIRHENNLETIKSITATAWMNNDNSFVCFVDQFANLNFIDLNTATMATPSTYLETNILTGEELDEPELLLLTNSRVDANEKTVKITQYTPISKYGSESKTFTSKLHAVLLEQNKTSTIETVLEGHRSQIRDSRTFVNKIEDNTYTEYTASKAINLHNQSCMQGMHLVASLDNYVPPIFLYGCYDIQILNFANRATKDTQDKINVKELEQRQPERTSGHYTLNTSLSGEAVLRDMTISYIRNGVVKDSNTTKSNVKQTLTLYSKNQS